MKTGFTILLTTVVLLTSHCSFAQKVRFTDSTNLWYFDYGNRTEFGARATKFLGDTVIKGNSYRKLHVRGYQTPPDPIREDTIAKKVYVYIDSVDILLYDFSQSVGDTFTSNAPFQKGQHILTSIDSIKIDAYWYKRFHYQPTVQSQSQARQYSVIENIGCINGLGNPFWNFKAVEYYEQLDCFHTKGKRVYPSPITHPNDSCYEFQQYVSVKNVNSYNDKSVLISPHPVMQQSVMKLPYTIKYGKLSIINAMGQMIVEREIDNSKELSIGEIFRSNGIYYYKVIDKFKGNTFSGKIVRE